MAGLTLDLKGEVREIVLEVCHLLPQYSEGEVIAGLLLGGLLTLGGKQGKDVLTPRALERLVSFESDLREAREQLALQRRWTGHA